MKIEIEIATQEKLKSLGVDSWSYWSCGISEFDWEYDSNERCYIQKGKAIITTEEGDKIEIKKGDIVLFPKGLRCSWSVVETIEKVYCFE